jgi:hypothetical protein
MWSEAVADRLVGITRKRAYELVKARMSTSRSVIARLMRQINVRALCLKSSSFEALQAVPMSAQGQAALFPNRVWSIGIIYVQI